MDKYGLTDNEKQTNLHNYNHALFRNMMYFLNVEWEINMLTQTVVVLEDKNEPHRNGRELAYADIYEDYLNKYIDDKEKDLFCQYLSLEKLSGLREEVTFDIHLRLGGGESELHNIILTPAFDEKGTLYCIYLGARNLQAEVRREYEEYRRQSQFLNVLLTNSYFHFSFDLTGDAMIREDYMTKDGHHLIQELTGKSLPVPFEEFIDKWLEKCEPQFEKEEDRRVFRVEALRERYEKKEHLIELEVKQRNPDESEIASVMQIFIALMMQPEDKHVHAHMIWMDIGLFQRKAIEDNIELRSSNEDLKKTLSQEQQYRLASLSGALLVYNINLTRNLIEEEFYEIVDERRIPMLKLVGLMPPCSFDEFCRRWCETKVPAESRETFLNMFNRQYMLEAYQKGERHLEIEFDTVLGRGIQVTLRNTAFLVEDKASGDILAMVNSKDVSKQREEEKRQRASLRDAYEAASSANTAKTDFLSRFSHDIRTPMNAIIGMAAIATSHLDNTTRVEECLREITSSGKYLLSMLTEVLDMSKIEAGKLELCEKEFDLSHLFDNVYMLGKFLCKGKKHDFSTNIQELEHTMVIGDSSRLQQVLMHLIDNSIKYTPEGGSIMLTVTEKPSDRPKMGCYEIHLEDNGMGIDSEYEKYLFEPFVRSENRRVSKIQGVGLGLPIAKSIVQMMHGDIVVLSEPNKGTKITVTVFLGLQEPQIPV